MFVVIVVLDGVDNVAKLKNERQEKFCLEYIKTDSQRQAAINAGYSEKTADQIASRLLSNVKFKHVQDRYHELLEKYPKKNKLIADVEEILEFISAIMRDKEEDTKDRLKSAEMLGKKYAMFTDKIQHEGNIPIKIVDDI